jgi:uncharacterized RDD family membrane protein YckC
MSVRTKNYKSRFCSHSDKLDFLQLHLCLSIRYWLAIFILLALLVVPPNPYQWFLWIPYGIFLPLGISYAHRKQQSIRQEDIKSVF